MTKHHFRIVIFALGLFSSTISAEPPADYYDRAAGRTGTDLKKALHTIIDGHKVLKYTQSGNDDWYDGKKMDVWEALVYTDSACPETDTRCGLVQLLYLTETRKVSQANRGQGGDDAWDREHVWPKSRGFPKQKQDGYTDLHHLRPADRNLNSAHSNYGYDVGGTPVIDKRENKSDVVTDAKVDKQGESFEPPDRAKGQVARMIFYMAVRYDVGDDGGDEQMPDLYLKDTNGRVKAPWIGDLCTLLAWHNQFKPTGFEKRRNERVMKLQGNRNPFIDEPKWANEIWGNQCSAN